MKRSSQILQFLLISLLIFGSNLLRAQNYVDLFKLEYGFSPNNEFKDGDGSSDVSSLSADLTAPIVLGESNVLLTGFLFEKYSFAAYPTEDDLDLYTLILKLGLNHTFSDRLSAIFLALPKFSSDLKEKGADDFQFGVVALFTMKRSQNFNWKFGGYYNTEIFGPFFVPLFGFYYQNDKWETIVTLPLAVNLNYRLSTSLKAGLKFNGIIKSFNLNESSSQLAEYLHMSNNEVGPFLMLTKGNFNIIGQLAMTVGRKYMTYEKGDEIDFGISIIKIGDERTRLNGDFTDGLAFKTSLIYRFPTN